MRLPEVLLDAVLSYSDLRTRSLAVTTSHEFCESYARLAKTLEGRWCSSASRCSPPASTDEQGSGAGAARALPNVFADVQRRRRSTAGVDGRSRDVYAVSRAPAREGETRETLFLGSGTLSPNPNNSRETRFQFAVPGGTDAGEVFVSDDENYGCTPPAESAAPNT